jgi:hypothetical protein
MADIRINADQWNAISSDEQNQITENLRVSGLLKGESRIVPDPVVLKRKGSRKITGIVVKDFVNERINATLPIMSI